MHEDELVDDLELDNRARRAAVFGCVSMGLAMVGFCSCYTAFPVAIVSGGLAFLMARQVLDANPHGEALAYANVAKGTGLAGAIYSVIIMLIIGAYITLYVGMIVFVGVAGMMGA